tara:strand:- start:1795 stop:1917 length:123 start_codon:yes stop_codon:yes gene_type:complete
MTDDNETPKNGDKITVALLEANDENMANSRTVSMQTMVWC